MAHVFSEKKKSLKSSICCWKKNEENDEKKNSKLTCKQKVSLVMLSLGDFMSVCAMSIISPFYPSVSAEKGVSATVAGFIFAVYALVVFLSSPIFGKILPKVGAKRMFVVGSFVAGIANGVFGVIDKLESYSLFVTASFIIRMIEALGASAYSVASYVLIVDIFPHNIGTVRGLLETFTGLGLCAGPGIGGLLYSVGGFGLPFFVIGAISLVIAIVNVYILPTTKIEYVERGGSLQDLLRLPSIFLTGVITVICAISNSFVDPTYEPHLKSVFGLSPSQVGLLFILDAATYGITSPFWGWFTDRNSNSCSFLMTTGLFGTAAVLLLLGPSPFLTFLVSSVWLNALSFAGLGIATAMTLIPTYKFILDSAVENGFQDCLATHSTVSGIWSSAYSLGEVIGPVLGGVLMENYKFPITSTVIAGFNFILAIMTMIFFQFRRKKPKIIQEERCVDNNNKKCTIAIVDLTMKKVADINENCSHNENTICIRL